MRKLRPDEIERYPPRALADLPRHPLVVVLDSIRSAYNVGAILRTADALRVARVVCCGYTPPPDHPAVRKTALGAEVTVPWEVQHDPLAALSGLRAQGFAIAALEQTDRPTRIESVDAERFPLVLVLGNEVDGVQQRVLDECDLALELPQYGAKHSLNVAVAFGVAGYGLVARLRRRDV